MRSVVNCTASAASSASASSSNSAAAKYVCFPPGSASLLEDQESVGGFDLDSGRLTPASSSDSGVRNCSPVKGSSSGIGMSKIDNKATYMLMRWILMHKWTNVAILRSAPFLVLSYNISSEVVEINV
jgi:hypothetical protein